MNGSKALYHLKDSAIDDHLSALSLAWYIMGNDEKQQEYAWRWLKKNENNLPARANLAFVRQDWPLAMALYQQMRNPNILDHCRWVLSINQSDLLATEKRERVESILNENSLHGITAFDLALADAYITDKKFEKASDLLKSLKNDKNPHNKALV
ncbi:MAG: hypothetical protein R3345_15650, partial [Fulvivirga sp.]|nr:hypothetical protein [Fulvivirga sp.]